MVLFTSKFPLPGEIPGHKSFGSFPNSTASASALVTYARQVIDGEGGRWVPKDRSCRDRCPWQQPLGQVMKGLHSSWTPVEFKELSSVCMAASRGTLTSWSRGGQDGDTHLIQKEGSCIKERVWNSNVVLSVSDCHWKSNYSGATYF